MGGRKAFGGADYLLKERWPFESVELELQQM